jgi:hypothetical protein
MDPDLALFFLCLTEERDQKQCRKVHLQGLSTQALQEGKSPLYRSQAECRRGPPVRATADEAIADDSFSIAKVSFGDILTPVGVGLMTYGFGSYFQLLPGGDISGVLLIYAFPILLLGFALKYAQLEPVPCKTTRGAFELRETQMTDNQKQVREDCTRYRFAPHCFVMPGVAWMHQCLPRAPDTVLTVVLMCADAVWSCQCSNAPTMLLMSSHVPDAG